jgi:hypothetical protein
VQSAPAAGADFALAAAPGPAIVVRSAAPIVADLPLLPVGDEADRPAAADAEEVARVINRLAAARALPLEAYEIPVGVGILPRADVRVRIAGAAQGRLHLPGGAFVDFAESTPRAVAFDLTGAATLTITVQLPGQANVTVNVELAAENFDDVTHADPNTVVRNIQDALANADLGDVVTVFATTGLAVRGRGHATLAVGGPAAAAGVLGLAVNADRIAVSVMDTADISAGPVLHVEVTPRVVVRFDGDPADIPDLAHATPFDVRRAINVACELASVPVRAEVPAVLLRVASSPADVAGGHPISGGWHLAELAASSTAIAAAADREKLFEERTALGVDVVETGVNGFLYLRVRNAGNVPCAAARLRLIRIDPAPTPVGRTDIATAIVPLPIAAGASHIEQLRWDPGGAAPRTELVLVVADEDRAGHRVDLPPAFATLEDLDTFVAGHRSVALRTFEVRNP